MKILKSIEQLEKRYVTKHDKEAKDTNILEKIKYQAYQDFKRLGIPDIKHEDYKYVNFSTFKEMNFVALNEFEKNAKIPSTDCKKQNTLFLNNGYFLKNEIQNDKIITTDFTKAAKDYLDFFEKFIQNKKFTDGFFALNYMLLGGNIFIYVPKNVNIKELVSIIDIISNDKKQAAILNNRVYIYLAEEAFVSLNLENIYSNNKKLFHNHVVEIYLKKNAKLKFYVSQNNPKNITEVCSVFVTQEENSHLFCHLTSISGKLIRNNITISLQGKNCQTELYGFYTSDLNFQIDNFITIKHQKPNCKSIQHFKGIVSEKGKAAFNGKIHVWKDAQKTLAYQKNNNILLGQKATINAKPQLIIEADDVKCSHGATIGQLDKTAMYYLRSRGISQKEAKKLLIHAFVNEILDKLTNRSLQKTVVQNLFKKLDSYVY